VPAMPAGRARAVAIAVIVLLVIPLVVAAVTLHSPRWYPTLDLAMTELRVRDVGGADTPLVGLPGRIGTLEQQGSHPGPISFYALAPTYRALGSSAWALQVGALVLVASVGLAAMALALGYGFSVLSEPWNPYMPLFFWLAFLIACWGMAVGDRWCAPIAVVLASFCAQTHLPYVGLTVGLGLGSLAVGILLERHELSWRDWLAPLGVAVVAGLVLWSPVVADQLVHDPGNARMIVDHFRDPPEDPVGLRDGLHVILVHLDLTSMGGLTSGGSGSLVDSSYDPKGPVGPGLALLAVWVASVVVAWRSRLERLLRLDLVIAGGLVLAVVSAGNIFGKIWYYLTLWAYGLTALIVLAVAATAATVLEGRLVPERRETWQRASLVGLVVLIAMGSVALTVKALDAPEPSPLLSRGLALVLPDTIEGLEEGKGAATGPDGRYVVTWSDALFIGSQGYGLVSELERAGLDVGVRDWAKAPVTPQRVIPPDEVTAVVHFASGDYIGQWLAKPGVEVLAQADPRTPAEREEYEALEAAVAADLEQSGLGDIVPLLSGNLFGASLDPRLSDAQLDDIERLLELGLPVAVLVAPPDVAPL